MSRSSFSNSKKSMMKDSLKCHSKLLSLIFILNCLSKASVIGITKACGRFVHGILIQELQSSSEQKIDQRKFLILELV